MIAQGIKINWRSGPEYVPVNVHDPSVSVVKETLECLKGEGKFFRYRTKSRVTILSDGTYKVEIYYLHKLNPEIPYADVCWGRSEIQLEAGQTSGTARWIDSFDKRNNGIARWTSLQDGLTGEKRKIETKTLLREQAMFRSALVAIEPRCVITGEDTPAALETAHIIPVSMGGREIVENGLMLRADLHRLYDACHFRFGMSGRVERLRGLSPQYASLLKGKRLSKQTLSRVAPALKMLIKQ